MMSPITETYLFGPKNTLLGRRERLNFFLPTPGNFCNPGPPLGLELQYEGVKYYSKYSLLTNYHGYVSKLPSAH